MMRWKLLLPLFGLLILLLLVIFWPDNPAAAQSAPGANCPAVVESALQSIDSLCQGIGKNESCYGFNRVDALFWDVSPDLHFDQPADRAPLDEIQQIATTPLDLQTGLWGVAALQLHSPDLPQALPGQAVMFLLMGDTTLENNVDPSHAAAPVTPVEAMSDAELRLYTSPNVNANSLGTIPQGTRIQIIGLDTAGQWLEILLTDGNHAWLLRSGVSTDEGTLAQLPVTYGDGVEPRYGPMQSFYFTTGAVGPSCNEAPDALVVQTPDGIEVSFNINNLDVTIGSTVAFTTVEAPGAAGRRVMIVVLFDGHVAIGLNGETSVLSGPGQAFAVTVNEDGLVDENSTFMALQDDPISSWLQNACHNAITSSMFDKVSVASLCDSDLTYYTERGFVAALGLPPSLPVRPPAPVVPTVTPTGSGSWGDCGSCGNCGPYAANECVQSPDGQCLWDPGRCRPSPPPYP